MDVFSTPDKPLVRSVLKEINSNVSVFIAIIRRISFFSLRIFGWQSAGVIFSTELREKKTISSLVF